MEPQEKENMYKEQAKEEEPAKQTEGSGKKWSQKEKQFVILKELNFGRLSTAFFLCAADRKHRVGEEQLALSRTADASMRWSTHWSAT